MTALSGLRNQRYCELLLAKRVWFEVTVEVYNTIGLPDCPDQQWQTLDATDLAYTLQVDHIKLKEPRYLMIDSLENLQTVNTVKLFGGIAMRKAAQLKFPIFERSQIEQSFHHHGLQRNTRWVFLADKPVLTLIDLEQHSYVMQSYTGLKMSQDEASLKHFAQQLKLPEGWQYQVRILEQTLPIAPVNGITVVIQDQNGNVYAKLDHF